MTITYIHGLSQSICRVLSSLAIKVTFHPLQTLRQELVHPKDPIPEWQRKGVVYSVPCNECSRAYIGQTGRSLDHRIAEHWWALRKGNVEASALAEHVFTAGHKIDLSKATVIDTHAQTCCVLESWHIQHEWIPLNRGRETLPGLNATLLDRHCLVFPLYLLFTFHLIMYICRSMLPYYDYSFIGFLCCCVCF